VTIAVSGQGRNQRQIVETLTGKTDVALLNGAIIGWDVPALLQGVKQLKIPSFKRQPSQKTEFSELAATFNITNGLAQNDNLRLVSPVLRVTGAGNIMLPAREIDYTVRPVLAVNQEPQATGQSGGLGVPVKIQGSWDDPKITPDLGGINATQAVDAVKQLGEQFKGKNTGEALKSLFGGEKSGGAANSEPGASKTDKAKQLLEGLFKQ
jgi:AsmA protein